MLFTNVIFALLTQAEPSGRTVKVRGWPCRDGTVTLLRPVEKTTLGMMWFRRNEEKVRVCSSSSDEGGGVAGGEPRLLDEREDVGLKQLLNCAWLLLTNASVDISN